MDIAVYVLGKKNNENVYELSFMLQDDYHLKKLGAYGLLILPTQLIANMHNNRCDTVAYGDYIIVYNCTDTNSLNVILFNLKPCLLKKEQCLFKILITSHTDSKMTSSPPTFNVTPAISASLDNQQLFKSTFATSVDNDSVSESSSETNSCEEDFVSERPPAKKQKFDDTESNQV
ncbi:hypothetical protein [Urbanus proteus nucleopolyhedrovirus]|uniref:TLP-20 n=1 Tax=Urbanus proteus nucleopolyhedrovirus TaxID=1675866 RepID=A0A162GUV3_9ABAC|nr:hypothetical protein [Urbanus proteus nucleopolyhedrovirus]AKR17370.1 hypothetical protein [Urbanus proteus nucleopolyhedrovirus]